MIASALYVPAAARVRLFRKNMLFMNAFYLMASTFVTAAAGFVFWIIVTHAYHTIAVGLATTLISVCSLLSLVGVAGFDMAIIRFLPGTDHKNEYINNGFLFVAILSTGLAIALVIGLPWVMPSLAVLHGVWAGSIFVLFTVMTSLTILTNAVFLAYKKARYIFAVSVVLCLCKVGFASVITSGSAVTILGIAAVAQLAALGVGLAWMRWQFGYVFSFVFDKEALCSVRRFSCSTFAASILNLLPPTLLPLIIVSRLGSAHAAYYYMAFTIAAALYTIAYAAMQSVFAEGSHDEAALHAHMKKAIRLMGALLVPASLGIAATGGVLLGVFGPHYAQEARPLLQLFALSALPVAVYSALGAVFKVTKNLRGIVGMNAAYAAVILSSAYLLVPRWGLIAVGWGWLLGNIVACGVGTLFLIKFRIRR